MERALNGNMDTEKQNEEYRKDIMLQNEENGEEIKCPTKEEIQKEISKR